MTSNGLRSLSYLITWTKSWPLKIGKRRPTKTATVPFVEPFFSFHAFLSFSAICQKGVEGVTYAKIFPDWELLQNLFDYFQD